MRIAVFCCLLSLIILHCYEELPSRDNVLKVFDGVVGAQYVIAEFDNSMKILITVKNVFDETFQEKAVLKGTIELALKRNMALKKTMALSPANLTSAPGYNSSTGILTLDPGDSFSMISSWNFIADDSTSLTDSVFKYNSDLTCPGRTIASPETFVIKGDLAVYEKASPVVFQPFDFTFCHINIWVRSGTCPTPKCQF